jgi:hypothetical protein
MLQQSINQLQRILYNIGMYGIEMLQQSINQLQRILYNIGIHGIETTIN